MWAIGFAALAQELKHDRCATQGDQESPQHRFVAGSPEQSGRGISSGHTEADLQCAGNANDAFEA
jgi:hypothetical protein